MKIHGNILKKETIIAMILGNNLQRHGNILQNAGNQLKKEEIDLKILGDGMIFVEMFRKFEIRVRISWEYPSNSRE